MLDTLFGAEMPLAVRFFLAFLIVLGLIGATAWAVRRFGTGRLGGAAARGRQPRLAVIDYASVDGRRRLILVRRDNVEHLMMIGGPTDVVVETNIVRATPAGRDLPTARPAAGIEALPRAIPLPETTNGGTWPLQPEPAGAPSRPLPRLEPLGEETPRPLPRLEPRGEDTARPLPPLGEAPPRPQRDTLAALADELSARPTPRTRPAPPRPQAEDAAHEAKAEARPEARGDFALPAEAGFAKAAPRKPLTPPPLPTIPVPLAAGPSAAEPAPSADQSLADMAQRLEAALRKTPPEARAPAAPPRAPAPEKAAKPDAKPASKSTLYDNLEQEMASLLGRPTKT